MIPTVRIVKGTPQGYAIINESDFDPARHVLYDAKPEPKEPAPKKQRRKG